MSQDILKYVTSVLNPDQAALSERELARISEVVQAMRAKQGLLDDYTVVQRGFIERGQPYEVVEELRKELMLARKGDQAA